jgi:hypothetical protein
VGVNDGADIVFESWQCQFHSAAPAAHLHAALEDQNCGARLCKIRGAGETIVTGADDDEIESHSELLQSIA